MTIPSDPEELYRIARKGASAAQRRPWENREYEDLVQEAVTWLLESPGRAWVRSADGALEDPEEQLVADIADHLEQNRQPA